jgi:hypothetical protein
VDLDPRHTVAAIQNHGAGHGISQRM